MTNVIDLADLRARRNKAWLQCSQRICPGSKRVTDRGELVIIQAWTPDEMWAFHPLVSRSHTWDREYFMRRTRPLTLDEYQHIDWNHLVIGIV